MRGVVSQAGQLVRVLMISDVYFPRVNGVSTSIQTFRRDLAALGCESWLVAPSYPGARDDEPGVLRQPSRYLVFDPEDRMMVGRAALAACLALRERVDLVHIQTPFIAHRIGLQVARELGRKTLETYHTFFEEYLHHYLPLLPRAVTRAFARGVSRRQCNSVDAVVAPSQQLAAVLAELRRHRPDRGDPDGSRSRRFRRRRRREVPRAARHRAAASRDAARRPRRAREEHRLPRARARRGAQVGAPTCCS